MKSNAPLFLGLSVSWKEEFAYVYYEVEAERAKLEDVDDLVSQTFSFTLRRLLVAAAAD